MNKVGKQISALTLAAILAGGLYTSSSNVYAAVNHQYDLVELDRNLLKNSSMENGGTNWKTTGDGKFVTDGTPASGSYCGLLPSGSSNACVYQVVGVEKNTDYVLKAKVLVGKDGGSAFINVKDSTVSQLINENSEVSVNYDSNYDWQYQDVELKFNTGDYTEVAVCAMKWTDQQSGGIFNSQVYVDDMTLEKATVDSDYEIVWADDFNENTLNMNDWEYELGCIRGTEQQHYVNDPENVFMRDGQLVLKVTDRDKEDQYQNPRATNKTVIYNSGSVRTHGKQEFLYGRIEIKAKLPQGQGVFPAFWTLGSDFTLDGDVASDQGYGWARCGEIDIMEFIGGTDGALTNKQVWQTVHTDDGTSEDNAKLAGQAYTLQTDGNFYDDYHIFGLNWSPNKLEWYVDDQIVCSVDYSDTSIEKNRIAQNALNRPQYVQLNLATGGSWTDSVAQGLSKDLAGAEFAVDYIYYAQNEEQKAAAEEYYAKAPHLDGVKDLTIYEGEKAENLLSDVTTTDGYYVDYSINNGPMFESKGGLTSVDLLCTGKDDAKSLANLPVGTYNIYYSAIPNDIKFNDKNVPVGTESYKFDRQAAQLTIKERSIATDLEESQLSLDGYVGDTLATIALPDGWAWEDANQIISQDMNEIKVIYSNEGFTKEDTVKINVHESVTAEQLEQKVEEATQYLTQTDVYTEESLNTLQEAVDYAETLLKQRAPATFAQLTKAYQNIDKAIDGLVKMENTEKDEIPWTDLTPATPVNPDDNTNTPSQDGDNQGNVQDNNDKGNIQVNTDKEQQTVAQESKDEVKTSDTTPIALTLGTFLISGGALAVYSKKRKAMK